MFHKESRTFKQTSSLAVIGLGYLSMPLWALPPAPGNDDPASPFVIGPTVPVVAYGTTVLATDDISVTTLPPPADDVDGPDVFYRFTPAASDTYRIQLLPWQRAPLRSSDRQFTIYIQDDSDNFLGGARASSTVRPVHFDVALVEDRTYRIGIDYNATTHDNFPFTLIIDTLATIAPDDCSTAEPLSTTLPFAALNDIDGASADYTFIQGTGRCAVAGTSPTSAPGNDHVYTFRPAVSGDYAIELVSSGFDGVLYVNTACPPDYPTGCLGASNHLGKHELVVVSLEAETDYYIYVDNGSTEMLTGNYTLIVDTAFAYETNEIEPNSSPGSATPLATPLNGGQLVGPVDEDWWSITGSEDDRIYSWVNNGGSANSTLDTDLTFIGSDGFTVIEFDDEDADGADAPIEDLRYIYATSAPVIAGARMTSSGTHYLRVTDQSSTGTVHRYRLHVGVEPGTRAPLSECEPNDTLAGADRSGKHYYTGVIDQQDDVDTFAVEVSVGDRVFVALDGDPERDGTGSQSPNDDPKAFHAKLIVYDPAGDVLISDVSDSNAINSAPDYPAQGAYFVARSSGTHYVQVKAQSSASQVGPEETYELAVFINDQAPPLAEDVDPVVALTPDYIDNEIDVNATDNALGDSGIYDVALFDSTNLEFSGLGFTPGDGAVSFKIVLINGSQNGCGKLVVTDCEGNTACAIATIDVDPPSCEGFNQSNRTLTSTHAPVYINDNEPSGPGIDSTLVVTDTGAVTDVNVAITIETVSPPDIDAFLISPEGTSVELVTDRGSSLAFDITDAVFDDSAEEIMPILSGDAPYTGTWLPEDPDGLAQLNGEDAEGGWILNVRDDSSTANGGARLVEWTLDVDATFHGPESFSGTASDTVGFDSGIESIVLTDADNVQLNLPDFTPGDQVVEYTLTLLDPFVDGSGTVVVTDLAQNTCQSVISLGGRADHTAPANAGEITTDLTFGEEVQADVPPATPAGVVSTINVSDSMLVGEVEVDLTIDTKDVGRLASTLTHDGEFAALLNRVGMDDRGSAGLTKNNLSITLDDDAPAEDDAHLEPALGSTTFLGLHQPDGRGEFIGDGITGDRRENMLLNLAGLDSTGAWNLLVGDFRMLTSGNRSTFRRWSVTIKSPCGEERYVGIAEDLAPGAGICSIALGDGAVNLAVAADFSAGDQVVDYLVSLVNPAAAGNGNLEITDCASNTAYVPISLAPETGDQNLPVISGSVNPLTFDFEGSATDNEPADSGIASVELAPYADNLQIVAVVPDPPDGAASVDFVVGLVNSAENGLGYLRVTDMCGLRSHVLVDIDVVSPACTGSIGRTKRYVSKDLPEAIPDNSALGASSSITVEDTGLVEDVNITFNITHPYDDDIDMTLTSPNYITLFTDIGSTGNDFIDTTLDDEAGSPIPDTSSEAPFTGTYQPEDGAVLLALDGDDTAGTYTLRAADDKSNDTGTFESWSLTIESADFAERYDGRASDVEVYSSGICDVVLDSPVNLVLHIDEFAPGDQIVRYSVELDDVISDGTGTVIVTDCAGNACEVPIALEGDALMPPADAPPPHNVAKNRFISFDPNNFENVAFQVEMTASAYFPESVGVLGWIGEPEAGIDIPELCRIVDEPYFSDTWPEVVHVTDCEVVPVASYEVRATDDGITFSDPLVIATTPRPAPQYWADCVGAMEGGSWTAPNGVVNFNDITAAVQVFSGNPTAPPITWMDVQPELPEGYVGFADIQRIVFAFQGNPYPFSDPASCP